MFNLIRKIFKQADGIPDYHLGPTFDTAGASKLVMNQEFGLPPQVFRGNARLAGTLSVFQHPQVLVPLFAPTSGLGGTQVGTLELQPLTTHDDLGI